MARLASAAPPERASSIIPSNKPRTETAETRRLGIDPGAPFVVEPDAYNGGLAGRHDSVNSNAGCLQERRRMVATRWWAPAPASPRPICSDRDQRQIDCSSTHRVRPRPPSIGHPRRLGSWRRRGIRKSREVGNGTGLPPTPPDGAVVPDRQSLRTLGVRHTALPGDEIPGGRGVNGTGRVLTLRVAPEQRPFRQACAGIRTQSVLPAINDKGPHRGVNAPKSRRLEWAQVPDFGR